MTEYGTGTLPYSGDNRDVVRTHTLNHSLSLYNENLRNTRRLQSTHRSLRIFSRRMSTIMMISRLQELVQNLYVEVLFVRCTWCLSAKRENFNIFTFSYFYYYVTQITKIYAHTHSTTRKCNARTCTRL